jgi:hypothetical protein
MPVPPVVAAQLLQFLLNGGNVVGNDIARHDLKIVPRERFNDSRAGKIHLFAARTRITHCQHRRGRLARRAGRRRIRCRGGHLIFVFHPFFQ